MGLINQVKLQELLKKKWVLGICTVLSTFILLVLLTSSSGSKRIKMTGPIPTAIPSVIPTVQLINSISQTFFTSEQLQAIEEQRKDDEEVGRRELEIRTKFPWFMKLPLKGDNYFVYFETNSEVFTGLLYPTTWDNVDKMKTEIKTKLKDIYGIPVDKYSFEWKVNP